MMVLGLRGRIRHTDHYGLSYWIWKNTRAISTGPGQPRTDDTGVLEQLRTAYRVIGSESDQQMISVDVGAYIGVISLAMAHFGPSNHAVHAFEADGLNFDRLKQNVSSGGHTGISVHLSAVSNFNGTAEFTRNRDPGTNHLGTARDSDGKSVRVYEVPVITLDEFAEANNLDTIHVLKIDAEGGDIDVLRGAEILLEAGRIKLIVAEIPLLPEQRAEMKTLLSKHGYSVAYITRNSAKLSPATEVAYSESLRAPLNMIAARLDHANQMGIVF